MNNIFFQYSLALGLYIKALKNNAYCIVPFSLFVTLMTKNRTSRSHHHHIDSAVSSDCSQHSHLIVKDQSECHHRNNHNSSLIQQDGLLKSTSGITLRKRRTNIPYNHRSQSLLSSTHLILIRLIILFLMCWIFYYIFISIYSKPKKTGWERIWYIIIDWLSGE